MILFNFVLFCLHRERCTLRVPRARAQGLGCAKMRTSLSINIIPQKFFCVNRGAYFVLGGSQKSGGWFFKGNRRLERRLRIFFFPHFLYILYLKNFFPASRNFFQGFSIERFRHERFITSRTQRPTDQPIKLRGCVAGFFGGIRIGAMAPLASRVLCTPAFFLLLSSSIYIILQKFFYSKPAALHLCSARAAFWRFYSPESQSRMTGRRLPSASMM